MEPAAPDTLAHRTVAKWLALGGVVGPAAFVADWAALGLIRPEYSPIHDAISRLAELGSSTRVAMTAGFIIDGLGLAAYGIALRKVDAGQAWKFAVATGLATLGVAAFPLGTPTSGKIHAAFAFVAYATLVGVPFATTAAEAARGGRRRRLPTVVGIAAGAALLASVFNTSNHGLTQRVGLTIGDAWVASSAIGIFRRMAPDGHLRPFRPHRALP